MARTRAQRRKAAREAARAPQAAQPKNPLAPRLKFDIEGLKTRRLFLASCLIAIVFSIAAAVLYVDEIGLAYNRQVNPRGDFSFLVGAGEVIINPSERHLLYEPFPEGTAEWQRDHEYMFPIYYPYPAIAALLTAPLSFLKMDVSLDIWRFLIAVSTFIIGGCVASTFKSWPWRVAMVVAVFFWFPLLMNVRIGQTGAFVAAATALASLAYVKNRERGAIFLGLLAIKPTAIIGPGLIILQERPVIWLRFGLVAAAIVIIPFALLGPDAFFNWTDVIRGRTWTDVGGGHRYNQGLTSLFGASTAVGLIVVVAMGLVAAGIVRIVQSKLGMEAAFAFAILGGGLVNPHSLFYDWGTAFVAIMLLRMSSLVPDDDEKADLLIGLLGISLFVIGQFAWETRHTEGQYLRPLTAWTLFVLGFLLLLTLRRFLEPKEPQENEKPDERRPALSAETA